MKRYRAKREEVKLITISDGEEFTTLIDIGEVIQFNPDDFEEVEETTNRKCLTCGKKVSDKPKNISDPDSNEYCWGGSGKENWVEVEQEKEIEDDRTTCGVPHPNKPFDQEKFIKLANDIRKAESGEIEPLDSNIFLAREGLTTEYKIFDKLNEVIEAVNELRREKK